MRNVIRFQVESYLGAAFMAALTIFVVGFLFTSMKAFNADIDILSNQEAKIKIISLGEKNLINEWASQNDINIPDGKPRYRYILENYPERPWLR